MSNLGVNANIYRVTKKYADLLDIYLVESKSLPPTLAPEIETMTIEFFFQLTQEESLEPQIQMISAILDRDCRERKTTLSKRVRLVIEGLKTRSVDDSFITELEQMASALSSESTTMLSRMQGYTR